MNTRLIASLCLLVTLVVILIPSVLAQSSSGTAQTISGTVVDPNGDALPRATVRLLDSAGSEVERTLTDSQGRFRFADLPDAQYTLEAELVGFQTVSTQLRPGAGVKITLPLAPVREQVVVTATRTDAPSSQLAASLSVTTAQEMESRALLHVSEALRLMPGATVVRTGGLGGATSLFVRGGESDYNKVLLDGIILNDAGGLFNFGNLMTENVDRVEMVRGPQSALFGSDAVASVVQVFTRRGRSETLRPRFTLSGEGGNNDTWRTRAGINGEAGLLDYSFHWARLSTDNREPNNAFHNTSLSSNVGFSFGEHTSLRVISRGELGRVGIPGQTAFGRPDRDAFERRRDADVGARLWNQATSFWEQQLRYGYYQSRQLSRNLNPDPPFVPTFGDRVAECLDFSTDPPTFGPCLFFDFTFDFLNHFRRHQLTYQSDWRFGSVGRAAGHHVVTFAFEWNRELGFLGGVNAERNNFGWVFQWQGLWNDLFLTLGARIEDNDSFGTAVAPRASVAYFLHSGSGPLGATKLKFNFGLGIKEPSLVETFSNGPFAFGNRELAPERTRSFDFGVEQRFWYDRAKLEANFFHNRFREVIGFEITSFVPFQGSFFNIGRTRARGSELVGEIAPLDSLRARASYTFLDSRVTESGTVFDPVFEEGNQLLRRPKHSGALEIYWDWRRLNLTSTTAFVGRRTDSDFSLLLLTENGGYTKWDLAWSYRSSYRLTYFGVVENLLNQDYMEVLGFPALKLTFRAGARVDF